MASGLVPSRGALPPGGATRRELPCVLTMTIETSPASAASSQYSPSRPMWLQWISVPTPTPVAAALADEPLHQPPGLRLAEAPVAVGHQERRRLSKHGEARAGNDFLLCQAVQIERNPHHAVRIVPAEVGADQAAADQSGLVAARPPAASR